jgi:amidophosphoribosyltransferase
MGAWSEGLREECGVVGVYGRLPAAPRLYLGLNSLQHRGQEGAGIAVSDGEHMRSHKGIGLVNDVLTEPVVASLPGAFGIGHNRYSTTGASARPENVQPIVVDCRHGRLAVAHNGNLTNARELRRRMEEEGSIFQTTSDSEIVLHLIARSRRGSMLERAREALAAVRGACTVLLMSEKEILGYRDPFGFRPLCLGRLPDGYVLASETCALDIMGAELVREIEPGEMVLLDASGVHGVPPSPGEADHPKAQCVFEQIYFSRPDSVVFGESVDRVRRRLGHELAREHPAAADMVIAVPDSSNSAGLGFAEESGIPFELGLIRNHYIGRTFIAPVQNQRDGGVKVKYNPVAAVLRGKRIVVVDDSIVRGTTSRLLVRMLFSAGAREVHFRVSSPPMTGPCFYGIDTPKRSELIASQLSVPEIGEYLGVTSLGYLSLDGLRRAVAAPERFCYACFSGEYPVPVTDEVGRLTLERG